MSQNPNGCGNPRAEFASHLFEPRTSLSASHPLSPDAPILYSRPIPIDALHSNISNGLEPQFRLAHFDCREKLAALLRLNLIIALIDVVHRLASPRTHLPCWTRPSSTPATSSPRHYTSNLRFSSSGPIAPQRHRNSTMTIIPELKGLKVSIKVDSQTATEHAPPPPPPSSTPMARRRSRRVQRLPLPHWAHSIHLAA